MNIQKSFEFVLQKLLEQGGPSMCLVDDDPSMCLVDDDPQDVSCAYRGQDGKRCAIGWLIPDELYDPKMEGGTAELVIWAWPDLQRYLDPEHTQLYTVMQVVHDYASEEFDLDWASWINVGFDRIAENFSLKKEKADSILTSDQTQRLISLVDNYSQKS